MSEPPIQKLISKILEQDLNKFIFSKLKTEVKRSKLHHKTFDSIEHLLGLCLRLNKSNQLNLTITLTIGRNPNSRPIPYIVKRRTLQLLFLYQILNAVDFHSLTRKKIYLEQYLLFFKTYTSK